MSLVEVAESGKWVMFVYEKQKKPAIKPSDL